MRKYRSKQCTDCKNYRKNLQRCTISKTKSNYNFFGVSDVPCLDFATAGFNLPEMGYKASQHFSDQAGSRNIARIDVENTLRWGIKTPEKNGAFRFKLKNISVIADLERKILITAFRR